MNDRTKSNKQKQKLANYSNENINRSINKKRKLKTIIFLQFIAAMFLSISSIISLIFLPKLEKSIEIRERSIATLTKKSEKADLIDIKNTNNMILCDLFQVRNDISKYINPKISKSLEDGALNELAFLVMQSTYYWNDSIDFYVVKKQVDKEVDEIYLNPSYSFNDKIRLIQEIYNKKNEVFAYNYNKNSNKIKFHNDKLSDLELKKRRETILFTTFQLLGIISLAILSAFEKLINIASKE